LLLFTARLLEGFVIDWVIAHGRLQSGQWKVSAECLDSVALPLEGLSVDYWEMGHGV
jgi:hypothetical protein